MLQCLHLIIDILLLVHGLVDDGLRDAARPTLLLVIVQSCVHSALLARSHIRSTAVLASALCSHQSI